MSNEVFEYTKKCLLHYSWGLNEGKEITEDTVIDSLDIDELGKVEVIIDIEEMYDVDIFDDDMDRMITVGDIVSHVKELI